MTRQTLQESEAQRAQKKNEKPKEITDWDVYFAILNDSLGSRPRSRSSRAVRAGRAGMEARGGAGVRAGRGRRSSPADRTWLVELPSSYQSPFGLGTEIIKAPTTRGGPRAVSRQADLPAVQRMRKAATPGRVDVDKLTQIVLAYDDEFEKYGIERPVYKGEGAAE